ncbi:hypothetical protein VN12_05005 [Pirellula sp. SH-Sr6A]|uniref:hypothetical protein n=1 Tax=Pirellula sp. SH-Sr6A TaxID=1632865 RepID=UPI00078EF090|nr:hypothetical protein [Pirellula sp. SH-Sr6A]AMV31455.1 hypothetical protein VN12_05005 [Pirellula sp. SH-Sr6A]
MRKRIFILSCASLLVAWSPASVWSQGKGSGMNRGLGQAAVNQAAGRAANQAAGQAANAATNGARANTPTLGARGGRGTGFLPAGVPATAAQKGMGRAGEALTRNKNLPGMTPEQIQFKRLQQADHLRAISERNGNEALLETADRMEASAVRNFERQTGTGAIAPETGTVPSTEPVSTQEPVTDVEAAPASKLAPSPASQNGSRKGLWFRWR